MKWAFKLEEFEVLYHPRIAIMGKALVDFVAESTYPEEPNEEISLPDLPSELQKSMPTWVLQMDRSSNSQGSGAGVILTTPDEFQIEYTLRFRFEVSNNEAEYAALLAGLHLATSMGAQILAFSDSQMIQNQILQLYKA